MDGKAVLVIGWVMDLVLPEGDIAHGDIEEIFSIGGLKASDGDVRLGVQLLGDAPGDAVQLHAVWPGRGHTFVLEAVQFAVGDEAAPGRFHSGADGAELDRVLVSVGVEQDSVGHDGLPAFQILILGAKKREGYRNPSRLGTAHLK